MSTRDELVYQLRVNTLKEEVRNLQTNCDFLFKTLVAVLLKEGGEIVICERILGEASLLINPEVVTQMNPDGSFMFVKLKTKKSSTT